MVSLLPAEDIFAFFGVVFILDAVVLTAASCIVPSDQYIFIFVVFAVSDC